MQLDNDEIRDLAIQATEKISRLLNLDAEGDYPFEIQDAIHETALSFLQERKGVFIER